MDQYFMVTSGESGTRIEGPLSAEKVARKVADWERDTERKRPVLNAIPKSDGGYWMGVPDGAVLILRGEVVDLDDVQRCPCGSGKAFRACHGAETEEPAPIADPPAGEPVEVRAEYTRLTLPAVCSRKKLVACGDMGMECQDADCPLSVNGWHAVPPDNE